MHFLIKVIFQKHVAFARKGGNVDERKDTKVRNVDERIKTITPLS